ncbi:MAG: hypothetical protein OXH83_10205, partial [Bryobacterales bacterium]|nr:hypothetical protein [Bryobacterales bacterium]
RTSSGTFTYNGNPVSSGSQITVGGNRYRLTQASDGRWSAATVRDPGTIDTGGVAGPTQTDEVDTFTDGRFDDDLTDGDTNTYGVQLSTRGEQPSEADDRGTKIVPQRTGTAPAGADHVEFPVYDLMQQSLVTRERTYVEAAKAKLQEIVDIIRLNKELYLRDARDPDDHIADVGTEAAPGLWRQAEMAVGKIFGLTDFAAGTMQGILGSNPWSGLTLDANEVDDVIEALQDTIAVLSDADRFGREYEDQIDTIKKGTDGAVGGGDDVDVDAADFFNGLMSRIRFGSTDSTRFGAYVVKNENDTATPTPSDAARGGWTKGVFAYTPSDAPSAGDIPDRGEATYRGSTVAVSPVAATGDVQDGNSKGATLYAGKIELVASFTRKNVKGTVTELKDESGRTWVHDDGFGNEEVRSLVLPDAALSTTAGETGFYEEPDDSDSATAIFADTSLPNATSADAKFRVQLVDDAVEALGVWEAFGLEGAFGATRTGTVSKPTLPREADRGGGATSGSIHYITNDTAGTGTGGPITPDTEESTFSLARDVLQIATDTGIISDEEFNRDFTGLELTDLYRRSRTARAGSTFVSEARTQISSLRTGLADDNFATRLRDAGTILGTVLGISGVRLTGDTRSAASTELSRAVSALGSASALQRALADEGLFADSTTEFDTEEARQVYSEKRWDFNYDFGRNRYTRFGVWSQIAPDNAQGNVDGTDTDADSTPAHGSFAYSPLAPAVAENVSGLTFAATYEGRTLAVNESTGDLYAGQFILQVDWEDATPSVRTTITDLKGVRGTSAYFKYGTKDVKSIFFTGLTAAEGTLGGTPTMRVRYRDSSQDTTAASGITAAMAGVFVMDQDFRDEPVGVLGTWSITDTGTTVDDYSASFGAELKP